MNFLLVLIALWVVIGWLVWFAGRKAKDARVRCAACSYDLTACTPSETEHCPECGVAIVEAGVEHHGVRGGKRRRCACFAGAMVCALLMGFLVVLKFPPVMQTVRMQASGRIAGVSQQVNLTQFDYTRVNHPGYRTTPFALFATSSMNGGVLDEHVTLTHARGGVLTVDLANENEALRDVEAWMRTVVVSGIMVELAHAVGALGFLPREHASERDGFFRTADRIAPGWWQWSGIGGQVRVSSTLQTSPSPQPAIAKWLGLAPSIGADWERTTWLQVSNVVWYVLPSVIVALLFRRVREKVRKDAQRAAAEWGTGDTAILRA